MSIRQSLLTATSAALGLVTALGCSDATASHAHAVSLSFATAPSTAPLARTVPLFNADVVQAVGGNTLTISKAELVLSKIELARADSVACTGEGDGSECEELELSPVLVDLPVDTAVVSSLNVAIPAGTYHQIEAKIDAVEDGETGSAAFLSANPTLRGVSVRVEGTYNGTPFVYTGSAEAEVELEFNPPVAIGASGVNLTVHVDLTSWFRDGSGALIDPSTANSGGPNASLVAENIKQSFEAFKDDNHDGQDDDQ